MKLTKIALLMCALMGSQAVLAASADLGAAKSLIEAGKPAEAYAALAPFEFEQAGDQDFDYLLAVAALDSGQPEKAILIFDRVLSVNPKFAGARMDLGRAYFALKSDTAAREQFEIVLSENPPELAKNTAQKYLDAIEARSAAKANRWTAYAEATFGHDSNVNGSTSQGLITVPGLGGIQVNLAPNNLETSSLYGAVAGGGEYTHSLTPSLRLFVGADVKKRNSPDAAAFHNGTIAGHAGLRYGDDDNNFTVSLQKSRFYLAGDPNRDTTGVTGQYQYTVNPRFQISLFGAYNLTRYVPVGSQPEDNDQTIAGIGWLYALDPEGKTLLATTVYAGHESEHRTRADGSKDLRGVRVAAQHSLRDDLAVFGSAGVQYGDYDRLNAAFLNTREDWLLDASAGLNWKVADQWSVRPQVSWSKNNSNIVIYDYDRTDASVTVRWDFR